MKRIVFLLFFLVVLVVGLSFAVINIEPVKVNYYLGSVEMPLALLIVLIAANLFQRKRLQRDRIRTAHRDERSP